MVIRADLEFKIGPSGGFNGDDATRRFNEASLCLDVVGEVGKTPDSGGFSVWKGRHEIVEDPLGNFGTNHVFNMKWPNGVETLIITAQDQGSPFKIFARDKSGTYNISPSLRRIGQITRNPMNPVHMTRYLAGSGLYVVGSDYRRSPPWYWDGNIDRKAKWMPCKPRDYPRVLQPWRGRLFMLGMKNRLHIFYSGIGSLDLTSGLQAIGFRDGMASELVGFRPAGDDSDYAFVWGDRSLWIVQYRPDFWPLIVQPRLLSNDCDCTSNNKIVQTPDGIFYWEGKSTYWALVGTQVVDIGRRKDGAPRIYEKMKNRISRYQHLGGGFYHRERNAIVWSGPSQVCSRYRPFREPEGMVYKIDTGTWWPIDQGFEAVTEFEWNNKTQIVGTDRDGKLYLVDFSIAMDKVKDNPVLWRYRSGLAELGGDPLKFVEAILSRPMKGVPLVNIEFWMDWERTSIHGEFNIADEYDPGGKIPVYDPGGPGDRGAPPSPGAICRIPIGIYGRQLMFELHNRLGDGALDGPEIPMTSLRIRARRRR